MKIKIYPILFVVFASIGCTKVQIEKRTIKGTYTISEISVDYYVTGYDCNNTIGDFNHYTVQNPGKMRFTGKKNIQASYASDTHKTYLGYFDFKYDVIDSDGNQKKQDEEEIFQYEFRQIINPSNDFDTVYVQIIDQFNNNKKLMYKTEGNKIVEFSYVVFKNNCYTGIKSFKVR